MALFTSKQQVNDGMCESWKKVQKVKEDCKKIWSILLKRVNWLFFYNCSFYVAKENYTLVGWVGKSDSMWPIL